MKIVFLYGKEAYKAVVFMKDYGGYELRKCESLSEEDFVWLSSHSFFDDREKAILYTSDIGANDALLKLIKENAEGSGTLIIRSVKANERTKLFEYLKKNAEIRMCDPVSEREFNAFVKKGIDLLKIDIDEKDFKYLIKRIDYGSGRTNLAQVSNWLHQLAFYDKVTEREIEFIVTTPAEITVWKMIDCLAEGDVAGFVRAGAESEDDPIQILSAVLRSIRLALKCHVFTQKELGLSGYQMHSVSPFVKYTDGILESVLYDIGKGIHDIKEGMNGKDSLVATLASVGDMLGR